MFVVIVFVSVVVFVDAFRGALPCRHIAASPLTCKTTLPGSKQGKNLTKMSSFDKLISAFDEAQNKRSSSEKLSNALNDAMSAVANMMQPEKPLDDEEQYDPPESLKVLGIYSIDDTHDDSINILCN
jgi:hypothetical protein